MVWLVKDGCGIACVILAWILLAQSQYTLLNIILLPQPDSTKKYVHIVFLELFTFLALVAHLKTILTDPGSVPRKTATTELMQNINLNSSPDRVVYKCSECWSVKPDRAHHCSVCKRCIRKMDHHCPWVNNCVGERNQKFFILFTLFITIISFYALILAVGHFIDCLEPDWSCKYLRMLEISSAECYFLFKDTDRARKLTLNFTLSKNSVPRLDDRRSTLSRQSDLVGLPHIRELTIFHIHTHHALHSAESSLDGLDRYRESQKGGPKPPVWLREPPKCLRRQHTALAITIHQGAKLG